MRSPITVTSRSPAQVVAATIIGAVADIDQFDSHNALAAFTGAAPRQIASAESERQRLNRNGDRRMRYALHIATIVQSRLNNGPGRTSYLRKREEGKTHREALRCLKRLLVRVIYRTMKRGAEHQRSITLAA
ncbi:transposase [Glycomyces sp. L485]|uniref:transposase n=1 Tax=Glycomyces sp. L485 TaxID=2909235 RepID=UPI001F4BA8EA|nr:transposase [Glycomyces sp. L485]MCH7231592.1 transposase [Glycomyces sp. L485]